MGLDGEKEEDAPRTKRVPEQSRLTLRCHDAINVRGREREGDNQKRYQATDISIYI